MKVRANMKQIYFSVKKKRKELMTTQKRMFFILEMRTESWLYDSVDINECLE